MLIINIESICYDTGEAAAAVADADGDYGEGDGGEGGNVDDIRQTAELLSIDKLPE